MESRLYGIQALDPGLMGSRHWIQACLEGIGLQLEILGINGNWCFGSRPKENPGIGSWLTLESPGFKSRHWIQGYKNPSQLDPSQHIIQTLDLGLQCNKFINIKKFKVSYGDHRKKFDEKSQESCETIPFPIRTNPGALQLIQALACHTSQA